MRHGPALRRILFGLILLAGLGLAQEPSTTARAKEAKTATVEVCFVLDTTGSMKNLIAGAKRKIWSIANQIVMVKPTPTVRVGLKGRRWRDQAGAAPGPSIHGPRRPLPLPRT